MSRWKERLAGLALLAGFLGAAACSPSVLPASPLPPAATPSATAAPTVTPPPGAALIVLRPGSIADSLLLGGAQDGAWLSPVEIAGMAGKGENYRYANLAGLTGDAAGVSTSSSPHCPATFVQAPSAPHAVGLAADWDPIPRLPVSLSPGAEVYRQIVADFLRAQGLAAPEVAINQLLRVDVEGDGVDEVLIQASRFGDPGGHSVFAGDYAIVLFRRVAGNAVETFPLVADVYFSYVENQFPWRYEILAMPDLNGDGVLELAVERMRWEGVGGRVYQFLPGGPILIFDQACSG